MRSRVHWLSLAFVLLLLSGLPTAAQDTDARPLLEMLAHVPDSPLSRSELYFNDRLAIETAYSPAQMPADFAAFEALGDADDDSSAMSPNELWWRVFMNTSSSQMSRYIGMVDTMPDAVGFDFFSIDRELNYGQPPQTTTQYEGMFDLEAIRAALSEHGFVQSEEDSAELWCSTDGCDEGLRTNLAERDPANPFGGDLGRRQPILISENRLLSSASLPVVENHLEVMNGDAPSLAEAPEYRAAVEALTSEGTLIQAHFFDGELLLGISQFSLDFMRSPSAEQIKLVLQDILKDYETLPAYSLLVLGDVATDTEQIGKVALVYDDADSAKTAAELIPRRIAAYTSIAVNRTLQELLEERHVTGVTAEVVKSGDTGKYVLLINLPTPKATPEQISQMTIGNTDPPDVTAPGLIYRLLLDAIYRRDTGWLITTPREELEALAGE